MLRLKGYLAIKLGKYLLGDAEPESKRRIAMIDIEQGVLQLRHDSYSRVLYLYV